MPQWHYFVGTLLAMSSCASCVSRTHVITEDVSKSKSMSKFKCDIPPSVFQIERRSNAQNIGSAHGCLVGIYNVRYCSLKKLCRALRMAAIFQILIYYTQLQFHIRYEKIVPNYAEKLFVIVMTSSMTSQGASKSTFYIPYEHLS